MNAQGHSIAFLLWFTTSAAALAECDPTTFILEEVERYKFSDSLTLNAWDIMEKSSEESSGESFDLGAVIYGAPVTVNYGEAKAAASFMKTNTGFNFSRDQQLDFFRTNVSLVGASMYKDCLQNATDEFSVSIPDTAYTDDEFFLDITWTPVGSLAVREPSATAKVMVLNGTVDGAKVAQQKVSDKQSVTFLISREDRNKALQIVPSVDGISLSSDVKSIVIPPIIDLKFETKLRSWPPSEGGFSALCSDDGGGNCGSDAHGNKVCLTALEGMFIPSTVAFEIAGINYREPVIDAGTDSVCVTYSTRGVSGPDGFGKKGYSSIDRFSFSIRELVPKVD